MAERIGCYVIASNGLQMQSGSARPHEFLIESRFARRENTEAWPSGLRQQFAKLRASKKRHTGSNPVASANWENANFWKIPRGAERAARIEFERDFLAKRKRIYRRKTGR